MKSAEPEPRNLKWSGYYRLLAVLLEYRSDYSAESGPALTGGVLQVQFIVQVANKT